MLADQFGHVEHAHLSLAIENCLEGVIGIDHAAVLFVLEAILLNVDPEFLRHFRAGQRIGTNDKRELGIGSYRLHESGVWFTSGFFCHSGTLDSGALGQCNDFLEENHLFSEEKLRVSAQLIFNRPLSLVCDDSPLIINLHKLTIKRRVMSAPREQLVMRTAFDNSSLVKHEHKIRMPNRTEPMRDH